MRVRVRVKGELAELALTARRREGLRGMIGGRLTLCLVGVKIGRMENRWRKIGWKTMFSTVWQKKENGEEGKPRRKFSLPGPQFSSSQIGRKI